MRLCEINNFWVLLKWTQNLELILMFENKAFRLDSKTFISALIDFSGTEFIIMIFT